MIEVIFARRLLAISRDFPTEPTPRADIQSLEGGAGGERGREKKMHAQNFRFRFIVLRFRVTSASSIFLEVVEISFQ